MKSNMLGILLLICALSFIIGLVAMVRSGIVLGLVTWLGIFVLLSSLWIFYNIFIVDKGYKDEN